MAVLHQKLGFRYQRIRTDDTQTEDELAGWHDVFGRSAGIEMCAGRCFKLGEDGETPAIDFEIGGFRDRRDLACGCDAAVLVELDAQHIRSLRLYDRSGLLDRATGFVGHERHAGRGAPDSRHAPEVMTLNGLLDVVD